MQFGNGAIPAANCQIRNCAIYEDNSFVPGLSKQLITVSNAPDLVISNNKFGIDFAVSNIFKMEGYLAIEATQGGTLVTIDSNIFVNKVKMIDVKGGDVFISKIFLVRLIPIRQIIYCFQVLQSFLVTIPN